jgi:diguanylate cyclase (GGDEF)-like protein
MDAASERAPLTLVASAQEWSSRSLESILAPNGYAVLHAYSARQALDRARRTQPDLILLDADLPDRDSMETCRLLREESLVSKSTPIMMLTSGPPTKQQRLAALRAGAWELLALPVDAEELLLRLDAYVQAKLDADQAREEGLVDPITGLYNMRGLSRRAREIGADAVRKHAPLACVVFGAEPNDEGAPDAGRQGTALAHVLRRAGRISDAIGQLGPSEFAIIAPATDASAAVRLAERLIAVAGAATTAGERVPKIRVGYEAVTDLHDTPIDPSELLMRATTALRAARMRGNGDLIRRYEEPAARS